MSETILPDVLGLRLDEALALLGSNGIMKYEVKAATAPREEIDRCEPWFKVIRARMAGPEKAEMIVCKPL